MLRFLPSQKGNQPERCRALWPQLDGDEGLRNMETTGDVKLSEALTDGYIGDVCTIIDEEKSI